MYTYKAKCTRVIDGDTIDANIDLGFDITIHKRIRLSGIDTPESRTRDLEEKKRGLASKDKLVEILDRGSLVIESKDVGKFGRVLGILHIYPENDLPINVNETLVKEGYAVEYNGGKR
jgi:micrococcal nuclease|tara:strand:- start:600 stop:953 length:354 start_codon:yes stop_codon:yes gene_type:complete